MKKGPGRPLHCRKIGCDPSIVHFKPAGVPSRLLEHVQLSLDELEALRLADLEEEYQNDAAVRMGISRQTFGRIVASARKKVAEALIEGKEILIEGGHVIQHQQHTGASGRCKAFKEKKQ